MKITVTATRKGLTPPQLEAADNILTVLKVTTVVHGAAHGGDTDLHKLAHEKGLMCSIYPASEVPSNLNNLDVEGDVVFPPKPPLDRNKLMVDNSNVLVAFPAGTTEELRSGTWAAIRYARKQHKTVYIVWPFGAVSIEGKN